MADLGMCQRCNERPANIFRAVGPDPDKFVWGKFERWCNQCNDEMNVEVDTRFAAAREQRLNDLYPGRNGPDECPDCGCDRNQGLTPNCSGCIERWQ